MGYRDYSTVKGRIVDASGHGDFTTIGAAIAAASSNDTIFVRPGTYTEDITITKNLVFFADCYSWRGLGNVQLVGKITIATDNVGIEFNGFFLQTNSDYICVMSGANDSLTLTNCYINCTNHNGFSLSGSGSPNLYFISCSANVSSTYALFTSTTCTVFIKECYFADGNTQTASSIATSLYIFNSKLFTPITISQGGSLYCFSSNFGVNFTPYINTTWLTVNDTSTSTSFVEASSFYSGTATAISLGAGSTLNAVGTIVNSSNTNAIGGSGSLKKANITFTGSSSTIQGTLTVTTFTTV